MKYVFLFCGTQEQQRAWEALSDEDKGRRYQSVERWFAQHHENITGGNRLAAPSLATTVRSNGSGEPLVTDGPFMEGNEIIGGYAEIEVADLDQALRMAKTWPAGPVEIRPVAAM
jgi:hypothetical protein